MSNVQRNTKRVRIVCPTGYAWNTEITDAETGEALPRVTEAHFHIKAGEMATAEITVYRPDVDIVANATITEVTPAMRHQRQRDAVYAERDKCVSLIARMAQKLGYKAGIGRDPDADLGWGYIVYVDLPNGQVSWHIRDSELAWFDFLPKYEGKWDGHSTEEKYERVLNPGLE